MPPGEGCRAKATASGQHFLSLRFRLSLKVGATNVPLEIALPTACFFLTPAAWLACAQDKERRVKVYCPRSQLRMRLDL